MSKTDIPAEVAAAYEGFPQHLQAKALAMRDAILAAAAQHKEIGPLQETLKWGVPSYLPKTRRTGSTVRVGPLKDGDEMALFFICTSGLMDEFRTLYPETFNYHGTRALTLKSDFNTCRQELHHIVALALTSKLRKRK